MSDDPTIWTDDQVEELSTYLRSRGMLDTAAALKRERAGEKATQANTPDPDPEPVADETVDEGKRFADQIKAAQDSHGGWQSTPFY